MRARNGRPSMTTISEFVKEKHDGEVRTAANLWDAKGVGALMSEGRRQEAGGRNPNSTVPLVSWLHGSRGCIAGESNLY